jgi:hypothetical protein
MNDGGQALQRIRDVTGRRLAQLCVGLAVALIVGGLTGQMGAKPALAYACTEYGWQYDVNTKYGTVANMSGFDNKSYNATAGNMVMTLTSTTTGKVGVQVTVTGTFNIGAIVAGAQLSTSVSLQAEYSWSIAHQVSFNVPSHKWGNGIFGPLLWKTYGHYYYLSPTCVVSHSQYITTLVPEYAAGWYVWISAT